MTANTLLRQLATTVTPSQEDFNHARYRIESAAKLLYRSEFGVRDYEVSGSCAKRTAVCPVDDLDVMVYLDPSVWITRQGTRYQPSTVIRLFAERFEIARRVHIENGHLTVRRQNSSIRLQYHKEGSVHIDIVPAFWINENSHRVAEIPDRYGKNWIRTCVRRQLNLIDREDDPYHSLRRAIRLLKVWRNGHKLKELRSYALELLAVFRWQNGAPHSDVGTFRQVLEWIVLTGMREPVAIPDIISRYELPKRHAVVIMDVGVHSNNVASNVDAPTRDGIVRVARATLRGLDQVDEALESGQTRTAIRLLKDAMGRG